MADREQIQMFASVVTIISFVQCKYAQDTACRHLFTSIWNVFECNNNHNPKIEFQMKSSDWCEQHFSQWQCIHQNVCIWRGCACEMLSKCGQSARQIDWRTFIVRMVEMVRILTVNTDWCSISFPERSVDNQIIVHIVHDLDIRSPDSGSMILFSSMYRCLNQRPFKYILFMGLNLNVHIINWTISKENLCVLCAMCGCSKLFAHCKSNLFPTLGFV